MKMQCVQLLLVAGLAAAWASPSRPRYIGCVDSSECGPWECCQIGGGRFAVPKCMPLRDIGELCRPGGDRPINTTVWYPDGLMVNLPAVFMHLCPCMDGLECSTEDGACTASEEHDYNTL